MIISDVMPFLFILQMHEFVDTLTKQLVRTGNLDGILLTGELQG